MNFKRIQWIFLVAFLIFDIVVISTLLVQNRFTISNGSYNQQTMIIKEMHGDAISCGPMSNRQQTGYYLSGSRSSDNGQLEQQVSRLRNQDCRFNDELTSELNTPVKINPRHPAKRLDRMVANPRLIALGSDYQYSPSLSDKNVVIYSQRVANRSLFTNEGQIRFRLNANHEVTGYTQTYLENVKTLRPQETVISQQHAVAWLYKHNLIPNNSQVRWAKLAYTKLLATNNHNQAVYLPTWVVEIKTKNSGTVQRIRVNAFNSTVLKGTPANVNTDDKTN